MAPSSSRAKCDHGDARNWQPVAPEHAARMLDLKAVGLGDHDDIFIDITISDCGTGKPAASHKPGSKSNRKGEEKRFVGLPEAQMCYPSYGATGRKNKDAKALHKRISNAIASADPSVSLSVVSSRVNQVISVAIQRAIAFFFNV